MARQVDTNKILLIKKATMEVVVNEGVSGASINKIAKKAGVSDGYLYRFYKGKRELLEALFQERFGGIHELLLAQVQTKKDVKNIVTAFVFRIYEAAEKEPNVISFTYKLLSDFSFEIPKKVKENIQNICKQVITIGQKTGEINQSVTPEYLYTVVVAGTLQFINIRYRNIFSSAAFTEKDIQHCITISLKALQ